MWKPCLPGFKPVMSATTFTPSLPPVNVTVPATSLPEAALKTATAFVVSSAAPADDTPKQIAADRPAARSVNDFCFMGQTLHPIHAE